MNPKPLIIRHHIPPPGSAGRQAVARAQRLLLARAERITPPTPSAPRARNEQAEPDTAA